MRRVVVDERGARAVIGPLEICLYESHASNEPLHVKLDWADLVANLADKHEESPCSLDPAASVQCLRGKCPSKSLAGAWSPTTLKPGTTRANENVETVNALVLDLDHLPDDDATQTEIDKVLGAGLALIAHTTHSHSEKNQCLRLVVPLSRPVPASQWRGFRTRVVERLGFAEELDDLKDESRIYYLPSHPKGSDDWGSSATDGKALDVDAFLSGIPKTTEPAKTTAPAKSKPSKAAAPKEPEIAVDMHDLVLRIKTLRNSYARRADTQKVGLLDAMLAGNPLAPEGRQSNALHTTASILATTFPAHTPAEAAIELLRRSINAMGAGSEGLEHWFDSARSSYDRAMERRVVADAEREAMNSKLVTGMQELVPRMVLAKERAESAVSEEAPDDPDAWMADLIVRPVKDASEEPKIVNCEHNTTLLLTNLPEWREAIRFNDLTKDIDVVGGPLPKTDRHTSVLAVATASWLHRNHGIAINARQVEGPILLIARRNVYDPIADYLDSLTWDGTERLHRLLLDHADAHDLDSGLRDITTHVERITRRWMLSAAVRALKPGSQADSVLVLEGTTGSGKTSFFRSLAGEFYAPLKTSLDSKDTSLVAARSWIIEIGELASIRRSDRESNNNELTTSTDLVRVPYGRTVEVFPRRCVFGGTTEDDDWLSSVKGIRRWWPVRVGKVDNSWIIENRDRLWAEAAFFAREALACPGADKDTSKLPEHLRWWLSGEEEELAHQIAAERHNAGTTEETVIAWWSGLEPNKRPTRITVSQVMQAALGANDLSKPNKAAEREVTDALRSMGFERGQRERIGNTRGYFWSSTEELRAMPRVRPGEGPSPIQLLKNAGNNKT